MYDMNWLTLVSGLVLPMLVALVTARVASGSVKSGALALLSVVSGFVNELVSVDGLLSAISLNEFAFQTVTTFVVAVGVHYGLLKPTGITGSQGSIQSAVTGGVGDRGRHAA